MALLKELNTEIMDVRPQRKEDHKALGDVANIQVGGAQGGAAHVCIGLKSADTLGTLVGEARRDNDWAKADLASELLLVGLLELRGARVELAPRNYPAGQD